MNVAYVLIVVQGGGEERAFLVWAVTRTLRIVIYDGPSETVQSAHM